MRGGHEDEESRSASCAASAAAAWSWRARVLRASRRVFEDTVRELEGEDASVAWASEWRPCAPRVAGDGGPRLNGTHRAEDGGAGADTGTTSGEAGGATAADEPGRSSDSGADAARGALRDAAPGDDAAEGEPHAVTVARCDAAVQCDGASASGPDRSRDDGPGRVVPAPEPPVLLGVGVGEGEEAGEEESGGGEGEETPEPAAVADPVASRRVALEEELRVTRELIAERLKFLTQCTV